MFVMEKTRELYYISAYLTEFDATVLSCRAGENGDFFVILDETAFFPEQGGQSSDFGMIRDMTGKVVTVKHVSIENGIITHLIDGELMEGMRIHGSVDYEHRFSNMQQHTGEHIFSGLVNSRFGYDNVGFHLSDSEVTMDYNGVLSEKEIREIELEANGVIWQNTEVRADFPSEEELKVLNYRSKKELSGDIRIVTIPDVDICACCAPHVDRTGAIGILKVISCQNYKGGVRVSILCGNRAVRYINHEHDIMRNLTKLLTTGADQIYDSVRRQAEEISVLKGELSACREKIMQAELEQVDSNLVDVFFVKEAGFDANLMRKTVNSLAAKHRGFCGVFSGSDDEGYKYIVASGTDGKDAGLLQNMLKEKFSARGGGNKKMVQGSLPGGKIGDVLEGCREI